METFRCSVCAQLLFFDNSVCLGCRSPVGYVVDAGAVLALRVDGAALVRADGEPGEYRHCRNQLAARCNWLIANDDANSLCASCRLTSVRPNDSELEVMDAFANAESAKRRLIYQLRALGLPVIDRATDPLRGVTFELLSSRRRAVTTGHDGGVITLDLSESDDAHREFVRQQLGEPYRTVLGHLRHEIAHYYWPLLVLDQGWINEYRRLFGDETEPYDVALGRHYQQLAGQQGPGFDWSLSYVSQYATMHPWEDWAETFAHYLHIDAGLATARSFGVEVGEPSQSAGATAVRSDVELSIAPVVRDWLVLTLALNGVSRSLGQSDLYPFVLPPRVVEKLDFVHRVVATATK
ncbi:MAG TPA: putative zinc-binding metallopeptidase [Ilumatobacter sp.]|nr:putative zinc-binding metallopeptidase [Ilumatobacter sp.]